MISTDPPRHRHLRSLAVQAFTQKRVAQLEPRIREISAAMTTVRACARLESQIALTELLARYPRIRRDSTAPLQLRQSSVIYSLRSYPVRLNG